MVKDLRSQSGDKGEPEGRVVFIMDELHRLDNETVRMLMSWMRRENGLGNVDEKIPVIFAYSARALLSGSVIREEIEKRTNIVIARGLETFAPPDKDPLPYMQLLLSHNLTQGVRFREKRETHLKVLHRYTGGWPGRFSGNELLQGAIETLTMVEELVKADDEEELKATGSGGGA